MNDSYPYIDFTNYVVDVNSIEKSFNIFHEKLYLLQYVNKDDKIGFDKDNKIYISESGLLQAAFRWYNGETRVNTLSTLSRYLDDYTKLLQMLKLSIRHLESDGDEFVKFMSKRKDFNQNILRGLENLSLTYEKDKNSVDALTNMKRQICNYEKYFL